MSTKISIEDIHEYLKTNWYDNEGWSDFNMAIDSGYTEYAAYLISGAINSELCYEYAKSIERSIEKLLRSYGSRKRQRDQNECFSNAKIYVNDSNGEYAFIKNDYVDYLMSDDEMIRLGFTSCK